MRRFDRMPRNLCSPLLALLLTGMVVSGCGSSEATSTSEPGTPTPSVTKTDGGQEGVTFQATLLTAPDMAGRGHQPDHIGFLVRLDTHSGSLLSYDLVALAELRDDTVVGAQALGWEPESDDSHHRSGLLYFARTLSDGQPVVAADAQYVELSLKDIGGVPERVLRWETSLPAFQNSPGES